MNDLNEQKKLGLELQLSLFGKTKLRGQALIASAVFVLLVESFFLSILLNLLVANTTFSTWLVVLLLASVIDTAIFIKYSVTSYEKTIDKLKEVLNKISADNFDLISEKKDLFIKSMSVYLDTESSTSAYKKIKFITRVVYVLSLSALIYFIIGFPVMNSIVLAIMISAISYLTGKSLSKLINEIPDKIINSLEAKDPELVSELKESSKQSEDFIELLKTYMK